MGRTNALIPPSCNSVYFNSLAPCGANLFWDYQIIEIFLFQLTRPVWGEPLVTDEKTHEHPISTHSPRVGRTKQVKDGLGSMSDFNSLAPCGANPRGGTRYREIINFNSLAPCGANLFFRACNGVHSKFQLTRPVWGEPSPPQTTGRQPEISTHSPRVGRTMKTGRARPWTASFQLTRPVWGEPRIRLFAVARRPFQLTRPVWGEPRVYPLSARVRANFNSLAPCGANLSIVFHSLEAFGISTHSPRVGRTRRNQELAQGIPNFNSLAPCGANRLVVENTPGLFAFQLTRPVWGEPIETVDNFSAFVNFNSLAPCGANHRRRRDDRI